MKRKLELSEEEMISDLAFDFTVTVDCGGELTMPDYYPEIKRIVSVTAEALPDSRFLSESSLEYGGTVAFTVLYIGDDSALHSVPYATEYTGNAEIPTAPLGSAGIFIDTVTENPHCRVLSPRRISLKVRLRTEISSDSREIYRCRTKWENKDTEENAEDTLEVLSRCYSTLSRGRAYATGTVSGEIVDISGTPVSCKGALEIVSVNCFSDAINVCGNVIISGIVLSESGKYETYREKLPFEESLSADGAPEGSRATAFGKVASVSVELSETDGTVRTEAEYDLTAYWCCGNEITLTDDAYSKEFEYELSRTEYGIISPVCTKFGNLTVSGESPLTEKSHAIGDIIDICVRPAFEKAEVKDGKLTFSGTCKFIIYSVSEGEVFSDEFDAPMKYEIPVDSPEVCQSVPSSELLWKVIPSVTDALARFSDGKGIFRTELCLSAYAVRKRKVTPVTEISLSNKLNENSSCDVIRICYPEKGTPLWDIAKNKRADVFELERTNDVKLDSVSDGSPLILR